jgi:hypothetical protein
MRIRATTSSLSRLQARLEEDLRPLLEQNSNFAGTSESIVWFDDPDLEPPFIRIEPGRFFPITAQAELNQSLHNPDFSSRFQCDSNSVPTFCRVRGTRRNESPQIGVSSIRITGQPYRPLLNTFARVFGFNNLPLKVSSIATNVPPELFFVIDVSGSTVGRNHLREDRNIGGEVIKRSEFVFMPFRDQQDNPYTYRVNPEAPGLSHDEIYNRLDASRSGETIEQKHFKSDYFESEEGVQDSGLNGAFNPPIHREYQAGINQPDQIGFSNEQYLGRLFVRDLTINHPAYKGPEPLRTVLGALENLVEQMGTLNVAGNRVGVLFFDGPRTRPSGTQYIPVEDELHRRAPFGWSRIFRSMTFGEARDVLINNPNSLGLSGISANMSTEHADRLVRAGIFPSFNGFTDATWGLVQAYFELMRSRQTSGRTNQRIVFISNDGLANCFRGNNSYFQGDFSRLLESDFNFSDQTRTNGLINAINCNALDQRNYNLAMRDIQLFARFLSGQLSPNLPSKNIALDVILMGEDVGPNLINIEDCPSSNSAQTQAWARSMRQAITSGYTEGCLPRRDSPTCNDAYRLRSRERPYRLANTDWLTIAWLTGGNFYPIVPEGTQLQCWNGGHPFGSPGEQMRNIINELLGSSVSYQLVR